MDTQDLCELPAYHDRQDLLTFNEKRGYWTAPQGALYISQVMGIHRDQSVVNTLWIPRDGQKALLEAFLVPEELPFVKTGITLDSFQEWSEHYETRALRSGGRDTEPPYGYLTCAEAAVQLGVARAEAYKLIYETHELQSYVFDVYYASRDLVYPLRCVKIEDLNRHARHTGRTRLSSQT